MALILSGTLAVTVAIGVPPNILTSSIKDSLPMRAKKFACPKLFIPTLKS